MYTSKERSLRLTYFSDVLDDLDDLRHNDDSFVDFLLELRHSHYFLLSSKGGDLSTLKSIHNLHSLLIIGYFILNSGEILFFHNLLDDLDLR